MGCHQVKVGSVLHAPFPGTLAPRRGVQLLQDENIRSLKEAYSSLTENVAKIEDLEVRPKTPTGTR